MLKHDLEVIRKKAPNFHPEIGFIAGSGIGHLAAELKDPVTISYEELPHFPKSTVKGHEGSMVLGTLENVPIVFLKGRVHMYEGTDMDRIKVLIRTIFLMGCKRLIITNAAGSTRKEVGPGEIVLIDDHINFVSDNPLVGPNDEEFGPRFVPMEHAYDEELKEALLLTAKEHNIPIHTGVYLASLGPCFETPAEVEAFRRLGADLVGMSTIPEVTVANHCGIKVAAISAVVNLASGMTDEILSHEGTLHSAKICSEKIIKLIKEFLKTYGHE